MFLLPRGASWSQGGGSCVASPCMAPELWRELEASVALQALPKNQILRSKTVGAMEGRRLLSRRSPLCAERRRRQHCKGKAASASQRRTATSLRDKTTATATGSAKSTDFTLKDLYFWKMAVIWVWVIFLKTPSRSVSPRWYGTLSYCNMPYRFRINKATKPKLCTKIFGKDNYVYKPMYNKTNVNSQMQQRMHRKGRPYKP